MDFIRQTEFNEYPSTVMDNAPSGAELMNCSNDPSYGSDTNEWRSGFPLVSYDPTGRQPQCFPNASFSPSAWVQPSLVLNQDVSRYPTSYNHNDIDYHLMSVPQPTSRAVPPSTSIPSPDFPVMSSLSPPRTPASVTLSVGNSPNIQPSRAISSSPHVSTQTFDEVRRSFSLSGTIQERHLLTSRTAPVLPRGIVAPNSRHGWTFRPSTNVQAPHQQRQEALRRRNRTRCSNLLLDDRARGMWYLID